MNHTHTQTQGGLRLPTSGRLLRWLFSIVGIAAIASAAVAQTGTITGRVINKGTNDYVKYAEVKIVGTEKTTTTDAEGAYTLTGVAAGEVKLSVAYPGLDTAEVTVAVTADATVKQDVELTSADYGDVVTLATVRVAGAREGSAKAILEQKQSLNFKNVVSADAFGDIPEGNIGEFLKNLPGVSVDYVEADVRNIRVRGLPPKYATFTLDGLPVANSGSSDLTRLRAVEMEQISLATTEAQEVNKSPTADMLASGLGGNVNAVGKSAFSKKGRTLKYSISAVMNSYHLTTSQDRGWDGGKHRHIFPNANFEFGDVFLEGKLGVVFAANHSGSYMQQKILETNQTTALSAAAPGYTNALSLPVYSMIRLRDGPKPTFRDSVVLNLDYKLTDDLKLTWRSSYGGYDAEFYNKDFNWNANTSINTTGNNAVIIERTMTSQATAAIATASLNNNNRTATNVAVGSSNSRKTGETVILSPGFDWNVGALKLHGAISYSNSKNKYYAGENDFFRAVTATKNNVAWRFDKTGDSGFFMQQTSAGQTAGSVFDLGSYDSAQVQQEGRETVAQVYSGRLDAEFDFSEWSLPTTFKTGVSYRQDMIDLNNSGPTWSLAIAGANSISLRNYSDLFPAYVGLGVNVRDINNVVSKYNPTIDNFKLFQLFKQYVSDYSGLTPAAAGSPFAAGIPANLRSNLQQNAYIEEAIQAAYIMGTVKPTSKLTLLAGLRFEKTETTGKSFNDIGRVAAASKVLAAKGIVPAGPNGTYTTTQLGVTSATSGHTTNDLDFIHTRYGTRTTRERSYDNILPSAQAKYQISKNLIAKAAYFKSLLRPDYNNLRGGITVGDQNVAPYTFTRNNIDLEAETADNFEVGVEYYFDRIGLVGFNVWTKKLKDMQINNTKIIGTDAIDQGVLDDIKALGYSDADLQGSSVVQRINVGETSVSGAEFNYEQELSFLPGAFRGLGVKYNLSFIKADDPVLFSAGAAAQAGGGGIPAWTQNFQVNYKYQDFQVRLTCNYNSKKLLQTNGVTFNGQGEAVIGSSGLTKDFEASRIVYGLNTSYRIRKYAEVFLNVQNLTNEKFYRYQTSYANTLRIGDYGTTYNVGVKGSF